jgi:hypothetical protein
MNTDRFFFKHCCAIVGVFFAGSLVSSIAAQTSPKLPAAPPPALELKFVDTHDIDAARVMQSFQQLYRDHVGKDFQMACDPTGNMRIFVRGQPGDIKLLETFVREFAAPQERTSSLHDVRVFTLKHLEPDSALREIARMITQSFPDASFAIDAQRKALIVRGSDEAVFHRMEKVLHGLDVPVAATRQKEVRVRIVWLVTGWQQDDSVSPPPPDLKEAIAELAKVGFEKPRLIGQSMANVMLNRRFETVGTAVPEGLYYTWKTEGTVTEAPGGWLKLNISLRANNRDAIQRFEQGRTPIQELGSAALPLFNITTEITTPPGHFVVLAMTPTGKQTSAFVVQVLPRPEPTEAKP